jgi:hypothetical protein
MTQDAAERIALIRERLPSYYQQDAVDDLHYCLPIAEAALAVIDAENNDALAVAIALLNIALKAG